MLKQFTALSILVALAPGCRCSPSEDLLPASRTADPQALRSACPPAPPWAGNPAEPIEAEMLHATASHGTGYRLFKDGHVETYDDLDVLKDDAGRMKLDRVPGRWRDRGPVAPAAIEAMRKAVASADSSELTGARTGKGGDKDSRTHFVVPRDGKATAFCYLGDEAPKGLEAIEKSMHELVKYAGDATAPTR
ncbi:MAG: hypothetical protein HY898_18045 [Deltaproteobacteria bacterium]|nr:hypothetical protein [Deltaproteobacteria bacterium]